MSAHPFDADTALEETGPGRWRGWAPEHWFVARGPNGGFLAALAVRAAEAAAVRPLRSLTLHYAAAPAVGPLDVVVAVERAGRSYTVCAVRVEQEGQPMALGLATLGELPDGGAAWRAAEAPAATPLAEIPAFDPQAAGAPVFVRNYDMRPALAEDHATGAWLRTREPRALDGPLVAAMTDAWAPVAFAVLGRLIAAPTLDLTVHVRDRLPPDGMGPEDFLLGRFSSRLAVGGVWEEDGELWTPDGRLLAQSRQLALVREIAA